MNRIGGAMVIEKDRCFERNTRQCNWYFCWFPDKHITQM